MLAEFDQEDNPERVPEEVIAGRENLAKIFLRHGFVRQRRPETHPEEPEILTKNGYKVTLAICGDVYNVGILASNENEEIQLTSIIARSGEFKFEDGFILEPDKNGSHYLVSLMSHEEKQAFKKRQEFEREIRLMVWEASADMRKLFDGCFQGTDDPENPYGNLLKNKKPSETPDS
jgi:hypothetical protein